VHGLFFVLFDSATRFCSFSNIVQFIVNKFRVADSSCIAMHAQTEKNLLHGLSWSDFFLKGCFLALTILFCFIVELFVMV